MPILFFKRTAGMMLALFFTLHLAVSVSAQATTMPEPDTATPDIIVYNPDRVYVDGLMEELQRVPNPILQSFSEQGWSLRLDQDYLEYLSDRYGYTCIAATSYKNKGIYLTTAGSLLHEFGHFLDWSMDFPEEVDRIFEKEAQSACFLRAYAKSSRREYFADYFSLWISQQDDDSVRNLMRQETPGTYDYFTQLEENGWIAVENSPQTVEH